MVRLFSGNRGAVYRYAALCDTFNGVVWKDCTVIPKRKHSQLIAHSGVPHVRIDITCDSNKLDGIVSCSVVARSPSSETTMSELLFMCEMRRGRLDVSPLRNIVIELDDEDRWILSSHDATNRVRLEYMQTYACVAEITRVVNDSLAR